MPSAQIFVVCLLWVMSFWIVLNYILGDAFQAWANRARFCSVIAAQWTKPCVSLSQLFYIKILFWAMPSARATPGSLKLGYCCAMNQALRIPIAILFLGWNIFFVKYFRIVLFFWRCLRPGVLRARFARLLLRNEPSPVYPSRNFVFRLKYFFWAMPSARATPGSLSLGYCFAMNQALRIPIAIILCWSFMWAMPIKYLLFKLLGRCLRFEFILFEVLGRCLRFEFILFIVLGRCLSGPGY